MLQQTRLLNEGQPRLGVHHGVVGASEQTVCADVDCRAADPCELAEASCDDGLDNDGDGYVDLADPGCGNSDWTTENPQCDDGVDNDNNGDTDLDDPQCGAASGDREKASRGCGLGAELPLLLPPLLWLRWRRSRRA